MAIQSADTIEEMIDRIIREVAELPDRTSPLDWPEAMLVTYSELAIILHKEITARDAAIRAEERDILRGRGETVNAEGLNPVHTAGSTPAGPTITEAELAAMETRDSQHHSPEGHLMAWRDRNRLTIELRRLWASARASSSATQPEAEKEPESWSEALDLPVGGRGVVE